MNVNFYAHKNDLDHINTILESDFISEKDKYDIEVYNDISNITLIHKRAFILITLKYGDFLKVSSVLKFQHPSPLTINK